MKKTFFIKLTAFLLMATTLLPMAVSCSNKDSGNPDTTTNVTTTTEDPTPDTPPVTVDPELQAEVDELLKSKHKLTFNDDGSFRVLIIADTHMDTNSSATLRQNLADRIKVMVDREDPNLVIFTGDNTINSTRNSIKANISMLVSYIEEKKIPWCHVYGNHDFENALATNKQQEYYEEYEYCISKAGPEDISGVGNYVNGIYNKDGTLGAVIYCLDSGTYDNVRGGYDYIKQDQIDWYKATSETLQEYNGGKAVPALMAFHIPLIENNRAYNYRNNKTHVYEYSGNKNEDICASKTDTNLFETALERGDVKAIVTGHDHKNDYMYNYKGIKLCSSPNLSEMTYYDKSVWGSRVFDMNLSTIDNMPTYVSYFYEKVDTSNLETYKDNVTLEYSDDNVNNVLLQSWNGGAISGTATVTKAADHGVGNSDSLKINRSSKGNFEFYLQASNMGKVGNNKYLVVWADFTDVEFRKACFGLYGDHGTNAAYRTDDKDTVSPLYYLADGTTEWVELKHGIDGCFGAGDSGSQAMKGKKGYFAIPLDNLLKGSAKLTAESPIVGLYFYGDLENDAYGNKPFYFDSIMLVTDYKSVK